MRMLAKHKAFTSIAVITLALGIGANTAIFSVVNELLLRPLPYRDAERIVMLWEVTPEGRHQNTTSRANFRAWREQNTSLPTISPLSRINVSISPAMANRKSCRSRLQRRSSSRSSASIHSSVARSCPKTMKQASRRWQCSATDSGNAALAARRA